MPARSIRCQGVSQWQLAPVMPATHFGPVSAAETRPTAPRAGRPAPLCAAVAASSARRPHSPRDRHHLGLRPDFQPQAQVSISPSTLSPIPYFAWTLATYARASIGCARGGRVSNWRASKIPVWRPRLWSSTQAFEPASSRTSTAEPGPLASPSNTPIGQFSMRPAA